MPRRNMARACGLLPAAKSVGFVIRPSGFTPEGALIAGENFNGANFAFLFRSKLRGVVGPGWLGGVAWQSCVPELARGGELAAGWRLADGDGRACRALVISLDLAASPGMAIRRAAGFGLVSGGFRGL